MSEVVIRAVELTKTYRLYAAPFYRFLDAFKLLGKRVGAYSEHAALSGVNLEIRRGEKVALIGRNGAGKSTLLKLITQVIEPSSGRLEVEPGVHALLQVGAGFHPDFTGRENARSYLVHLGVSGAAADEKLAWIVEFAELEEYIDQPLKTYSTGMVARLMFATSTAIEPSILLLDEILSVGDAYFAQKSYERMRELSGGGTTLVLVSHDTYNAARLCPRVVWLDAGRVIVDGPSPMVLKAYEDSIREQEERRLRKKKQNALNAIARAGGDDARQHLMIELRSHNNLPLPCPIYFHDVSLCGESGSVSVRTEDGSARPAQESHFLLEEGCWGEPTIWQERSTRPLMDHGSPFHKGAVVFAAPGILAEAAENGPRLVLKYWAAQPCDVLIRGFFMGREIDLGALPPSDGQWTTHTVSLGVALAGRAPEPLPEINVAGVHGAGTIFVRNVRTVDREGTETSHFSHGGPFTVLIDYEIRKPDLVEKPQVLVVFHRDGVQDVCRFITRNLLFDAHVCRTGTVVMRLPRLMLANGTYSVSVMVAKEGYYDTPQTVFYSINPSVYTCLARVLEIVVQDAGFLGTGTGVVGEAEWSMTERCPTPDA